MTAGDQATQDIDLEVEAQKLVEGAAASSRYINAAWDAAVNRHDELSVPARLSAERRLLEMARRYTIATYAGVAITLAAVIAALIEASGVWLSVGWSLVAAGVTIAAGALVINMHLRAREAARMFEMFDLAIRTRMTSLENAEAGGDERQATTVHRPSPSSSWEWTDLPIRAHTRRRAARSARRRWYRMKTKLAAVFNMRYRFAYRTTLARVPSRDELPAVFNARGLLGFGAAIGVGDGRYVDLLLRKWKGVQVIAIDVTADDESGKASFEATRQRLRAHGSRTLIWPMTSREAAARIPDASLDFAYIDAGHHYKSVKKDLATWFPKVKSGGILAGNDYFDGPYKFSDFGVKSAVDEFFAERSIKVYSTRGPSAVELFPSWIVLIPPSAQGRVRDPSELSTSVTLPQHDAELRADERGSGSEGAG